MAPRQHAGRNIYFNNLATGSNVKIFTVSAHEVISLDAMGTEVSWNRMNSAGDEIASGLYLYLIVTAPDGSQSRGGKLVVIR